MHIIENVFNILNYPGFFRNQGILTLEVVQEFYKLIRERPQPATVDVVNLFDVCKLDGSHKLPNRPVITLMKEYSDAETDFHSVTLESYTRNEYCIELTTIDSLSKTGKTVLKFPVSLEAAAKNLKLDGETDDWYLGSQKCYFLYLN